MTVTLCCTGLADSGIMPPMKYWEIVADELSAGWTWGYCSAVTPNGWDSVTLNAIRLMYKRPRLAACKRTPSADCA
jgi:hypothetical protein